MSFLIISLNLHRKINPVENVTVAVVAMGEGWHNYHHVRSELFNLLRKILTKYFRFSHGITRQLSLETTNLMSPLSGLIFLLKLDGLMI